MKQSPNNAFQSIAELEQYSFPLNDNVLLTHEIHFFHFSYKCKSSVTFPTVAFFFKVQFA